MFNNLGVKIVCLLVALLLWVQVASTTELTRIAALPLEIVDVPDSLAVVRNRLPERIEVRVRGNRLQLLLSDVFRRELGVVRFDAARERVGRRSAVLRVGQVDAEVTPVEIVGPNPIDLWIQRRQARTVPVRLELQGTVDEGYAMTGRPVLSPADVEARGPADFVADIDAIATVPVRLDRRRSSFVEEVDLVSPHEDVDLRPVRVIVEVGIESVVDRVIEDVLVTVYGEGADAVDRLRLVPSMVRVRVTGAAGIVDALGPEDVEAKVQIEGGLQGVGEIDVEVVGIDGVIRSSVEPRSIQVVVDSADSTATDTVDPEGDS